MIFVSILASSLVLGAWGWVRPWPSVRPSSLVRSEAASAPKTQEPRDDDFPEGDGKKILLASCTTCHDLSEVTKLRGYYTRAQWRDVVVTMKEYGAKVDDKQVEILTDYLTQTLGKK